MKNIKHILLISFIIHAGMAYSQVKDGVQPLFSSDSILELTISMNVKEVIEDIVIRDGDRICQMIIAKHEKAEWVNVESLIETERGTGRFGHTGEE